MPHKLEAFPALMISLDFGDIQLKLRQVDGKTTVFDPVRKKWLILTPEEHVRQYVLSLFIGKLQYPASLVAVEKTIKVGTLSKRFDIVVYDRDHRPWMLVECKSPDIPISEVTLHQLLSYQSVIQGRYWVLANGRQAFCADAANVADIRWQTQLPEYEK